MSVDNGHELTRLNWSYVGFVIAAAVVALGFVSWSLTAPVLRAVAAGARMPGGWSWWSLALLNAVALATLGALLWKVYLDVQTKIDTRGISQPTLRGLRRIEWTDVREVTIFNGFGWHVHGPDFRIVVSPYAYRRPSAVVATLQTAISDARRSDPRCS